MRKIRFIKHQAIAVLKSVEVGWTVKDVCCWRLFLKPMITTDITGSGAMVCHAGIYRTVLTGRIGQKAGFLSVQNVERSTKNYRAMTEYNSERSLNNHIGL